MSKITFGYMDSGIRNFLSPRAVELRDFLLGVRESKSIQMHVWYSSDYDGPALRIQIEGDMPDLERAMDTIIDREGLPHIIDQPPPKRFRRTREMMTREYEDLSTSDAYERLISHYEANSQRKPKTGFDNRTARAEKFAYHF